MKDKTLVLSTNRNLMYFFAIFIVFIALLIRNTGLYPVVFGDEYLYSKFSRLLPLEESKFPSYIYLYLYSLTSICNDGFLDCARILNVIFFVAATPFIYLTARRVCSLNVAALIVLLTIIGPFNSYTAYFMPEALYFFSFWLFTWFILRLNASSNLHSWCISGILLGLSTLVKPHAQFLLPAFMVYILYISMKKDGKWILLACRNAGIFVFFTFLTKFVVSYLFAGSAGLTFFGPSYSTHASSIASDYQRCFNLIVLSCQSITGHILAICIMFGLPIALAIYASFNSILSKFEIKSDQKISFFALLVLINLIIVGGLFTASISIYGSSEMERLHMRYYNFTFPLMFIIAASQLSKDSIYTIRKWRALIAYPIGLLILYVIYSHLAPYKASLVDSPELRGFTSPRFFYVLSGISFFSVVLWVYSVQLGTKFFVYLFLPLAVVFSTFYINQELRQNLVPNIFDKAGIFTKQYLTNDERSKVLIVGSDLIGLYRSSFYLDNPKASFEVIPKDTVFNLSKLPVGKEWLLVIGDHLLPENTFFKFPMNGFTLAHVRDIIDFKKSAWPGIISDARGLSSAEAWGTWSTSDVVTFEFTMPLPEKFTLYLVARAFGPNAGKDFSVHVGDNVMTFKLQDTSEERALEFINPAHLKTIKIIIPAPISPKSLGVSNDVRKLGIGLIQLRVVAKN